MLALDSAFLNHLQDMQREVCSDEHKTMTYSEPGREIQANGKGHIHSKLSSGSHKTFY